MSMTLNELLLYDVLWSPETPESRLIISLSGELAKDEFGRFKASRPYKLYIEWGDWSQPKRTLV